MAQAFSNITHKKNYVLIFIWFLFSILTGFSLSAIFTTGGSLENFYDRGDFLPFYSNTLASGSLNLSYDSSTNSFTVTAEAAQIILSSLSKNNAWQYMEVSVSGLNQDNLPLSLYYYNRENTLIGAEIFVLLLAALYIEDGLNPQNWKNPLVLSWFSFWLMTCVSDFFVAKESPYFAFYGYFMLIAVGFLFFVWSNLPEPSMVLRELCKVLEFTFILCTVYCLLFRPETEGYRYNGFYSNPNPFGLYLAVVSCAIFCDLSHCLKKHRFCIGHLIGYCLELAALIFFLFKTQSATAILSFAFMTFCFLLESLLPVHPGRYKKEFFLHSWHWLSVIFRYLPDYKHESARAYQTTCRIRQLHELCP